MTLPSYAADRRVLPRRSGRRPADVDTSSRTQITRFGTAPESRPGDRVAAPNGGSSARPALAVVTEGDPRGRVPGAVRKTPGRFS
jgi:hypothetical protein